ncbi:MAG: uridine diphosphate-N-acetylglucosamine-binding protein YvcK [Endomicrobia bacterium]|nr:uridine diphosphate-N-acetylglucosamine-binding protein YvcK [Endomicrobiia bacterium]
MIQKKKIVAIGGGTGLSTLLRGLREYEQIDVSAVVTVMDDGGSSGRLKEEFGSIPPGDIRNCLIALSKEENILTKIFNYRFPITKKNPQVGGHSLGNLLMLALSDIYGGFDKAIRKISEILSIKGKVLPITLQPAQLVAILENGKKTFGETKISQSKKPIKKLLLNPTKIKHYPEVVDEILSSDMIVIGPGSLFTSILPNLVIEEVNEAISECLAKKVYICNIMTQPGETDGYSVEDHIKKIYEHCDNKFLFDYSIVNIGKLPQKILIRYTKDGSFPVKIKDIKILNNLTKNIIQKNLVKITQTDKFLRHNSKKLAKVILSIL